MLLNEFFGRTSNIHQDPTEDQEETKIKDELYWYILDHDRLHKDYFHPIAGKLKRSHDRAAMIQAFMPMVEKGCKEFYHHHEMEGRLGKLFPKKMREELCQQLYGHHVKGIKKNHYKLSRY